MKKKPEEKKSSLKRWRSRWELGDRNGKESIIAPKQIEGAKIVDGKLIIPEQEAKPPKLSKKARNRARKAEARLRESADIVPISTKADEQMDIAMLENIIDVDEDNEKLDKERAFVGPSPQPVSEKVVPIRSQARSDEAELQSGTPSNDDAWVKLYGTNIKDTGIGMTPSGRPISDFLEGGTYPPKVRKLQSVTTNEYSYEELAEQNDRLQVKLMEALTSVEHKNNQLSDMEQALLDVRSAERVEDFNQAHTIEEGAVIQQLEEDICYLERDNTLLRKDVNKLEDEYDLLEAHHKASEKGETPLSTLANQYRLYMVQHKDDPVRNFLRQRGSTSLGRVKDLKFYLEYEWQISSEVHIESRVYQRWANKAKVYQAPRKAVRVRQEIKLLRKIQANRKAYTYSEIIKAEVKARSWSVAPSQYLYVPHISDTERVDYQAWIGKTLTEEAMDFLDLKRTKKYKVVKAVYQGLTKTKSILTAEINPFAIRKEKERVKVMEEVKASGIKRMAEEKVEREDKAAAKTEKRIKEAGTNLAYRGFIITDLMHHWQNK